MFHRLWFGNFEWNCNRKAKFFANRYISSSQRSDLIAFTTTNDDSVTNRFKNHSRVFVPKLVDRFVTPQNDLIRQVKRCAQFRLFDFLFIAIFRIVLGTEIVTLLANSTPARLSLLRTPEKDILAFGIIKRDNLSLLFVRILA